MKQYIIIIAIVLLLSVTSVAGYFIYKKASGLLNLGFDVGTPEPVKPTISTTGTDKQINSWLDSLKTLTIQIPVTLKNHSTETYTIRALKADLLTRRGNTIAEAVEPLKEPIVIAPQSNTTIRLVYAINWTGITAWFSQEGVKFNETKTRLLNYLQTEKLGLPAVMKGFTQAEGLTLPINVTIDF